MHFFLINYDFVPFVHVDAEVKFPYVRRNVYAKTKLNAHVHMRGATRLARILALPIKRYIFSPKLGGPSTPCMEARFTIASLGKHDTT